MTDLAVLMSEVGSGGMGKMRVRLMNAIVAAGYSVDLLIGSHGGNHPLTLDPRIRVFELRTTHAVFGVPQLATYLFRYRPRVLLTQRIRITVLAHRARAVARTRTRIFATANTHESVSVREHPPSKQHKRLARIRRYFDHNDGLIAISHGVARDHARLVGWSVDKIHVAPNPVIPPDIDTMAEQPVTHYWFQDGEEPVILGIGRLQPQKDFRTLLKAFAQVRARVNCRLVILGEGPLRAGLDGYADQLGIGPHVSLPGFVSNVYAYLKRSRLFVLSSAWEGFGNVLAEAMALDIPVVSTNCPSGPSEILDDGALGPLVPVKDSHSLATAILSTLQNPPPPGLLRRAAFERYTVARSANAYIRALGLPGD